MPREFYILSLKWTRRADGLLTWWGPDNSGYKYRLERSGRYTLEQVESKHDYYNNGEDTLAIPCDDVEALAITCAESTSQQLDRPSETHPGTDRVVEFRHLSALRARFHAGLPRPLSMREAYADVPDKARALMARYARRQANQ